MQSGPIAASLKAEAARLAEAHPVRSWSCLNSKLRVCVASRVPGRQGLLKGRRVTDPPGHGSFLERASRSCVFQSDGLSVETRRRVLSLL
jgi:hypothetical protein